MNEANILLARKCGVSEARLWETLVRPDRWWGKDIRLEAVEGGLFHEPWRDAAGQHHTRGEVLEIEPPRLLRLSWCDDDWDFGTEVCFSLAPDGEGCLLRLRHSGWHAAPAARQQQLVDDHRGGWSHHLGNLIDCAERGT